MLYPFQGHPAVELLGCLCLACLLYLPYAPPWLRVSHLAFHSPPALDLGCRNASCTPGLYAVCVIPDNSQPTHRQKKVVVAARLRLPSITSLNLRAIDRRCDVQYTRSRLQPVLEHLFETSFQHAIFRQRGKRAREVWPPAVQGSREAGMWKRKR